MGKQPEARWTSLDVDLDLGRAEDLAWALGFTSWGDPEGSLAADLSAVDELTLPLDQSWSVVFAACIFRGWLPRDEHAAELIGDFLRVSEATEARAIQNLIARIEASSDPRLDKAEPISGSDWPRISAADALSWALYSEADEELLAMPECVRSLAQAITLSTSFAQSTGSPRKSQSVSRALSSKEINALFTMFLAISYTRWNLNTLKDIDDYLDDIQIGLKTQVNDARFDDFQRSVIRQALKMKAGQFRNIIANAKTVFSDKANPLNKSSKRSRS